MAADRPVARDRWLSYLRTFRGYTEDEARLAAWAGDEIERLDKAISELAADAERLLALDPGHPGLKYLAESLRSVPEKGSTP